ncbi:uncharacterized protein LOC141857586 [Brevipalpus obovatus]|uniref:uncharacterized protein LOC141857586 n=1 Tax=Brevipalpus obovatus TaxID=246614 RepID=UPI003D9E62B3
MKCFDSKSCGSILIAYCNLNRSDISLFDAVTSCIASDKPFVLGVCKIPLTSFSIVSDMNLPLLAANGRTGFVSNMRGWRVVACPINRDVIAISGNVSAQLIGVVECYSRAWKNDRQSNVQTSEKVMLECLPGPSTIFLADVNTENHLWSYKRSRPNSQQVADMLNRRGLVIANRPNALNHTYQLGSSISWIDIIACHRNMLRRCTVNQMMIMTSDHRMLMCEMADRHTNKPIVRQFLDLNQLKKLIRENQLALLPCDSITNVEQNYSRIIAHVSNLVARATRSSTGWQDIDVIELAREKRYLRRELSRLDMSKADSYARYSCLKKQLLLVKQKIRSTVKDRIHRFNSKIQRGLLEPWQIIRRIMGRSWLDFKHPLEGWHQDIIEGDIDQYRSLFTATRPIYVPSGKKFDISSQPPTAREWQKIVQKIGKKRCQFADFLDSKSFSIFLEEDKSLIPFFNDCLSNGLIPLRAFDSKMTLIPKNDGKRVRPIAIMSPIGRVLDCCIHTMLMRSPDIDKLPYQWGFRRKVGSSDYFIELMLRLQPLFGARKVVIMLLAVDLENAFESFSIPACVDALANECGDAGLASLVGEMLSNRISLLPQNDGCMSFRTLTRGSFQGGFISPLLFNIVSKNIYLTDCRSWPISTIKYANDILIISKAINIPNIEKVGGVII